MKNDKSYYNFLGISRKEFPKWEGWKIINGYKEKQVPAKDIKDENLMVLVKNFHYVRFMKKQFFTENQ